jgi:hypothetical protein
MIGSQRGTALAETALVVSMALLVIFNGVQLGLLSFYQLNADASAFTAARLEGLTGSASTAQNTSTNTLPPAADSYAITQPTASLSQAVVTKTGAGLLLLPGAPAGVTVRGEHQEPTAPAPGTGFSFAFAVPLAQTFIVNYFAQGATNAAGSGGTHDVYLAQNVDTTTNAQGWNGAFAEWSEHQKCFASINFPSQYSATQNNGQPLAQWTSFPNNSAEAAIYSWDANGNNGKGKKC